MSHRAWASNRSPTRVGFELIRVRRLPLFLTGAAVGSILTLCCLLTYAWFSPWVHLGSELFRIKDQNREILGNLARSESKARMAMARAQELERQIEIVAQGRRQLQEELAFLRKAQKGS